jgi:multicomponent Na+:H+ antiporter subunit D
MSELVILPLLIPLLTAASALIRLRKLRRAVVRMGLILNLGICLILLASEQTGIPLASQIGGRPAPFGITLIVDSFSGVMLVISAVIALAVAIFAQATIDINRERFEFFPLLALLVAGINFAFLTGDVFTLYVAFEVMLMASFVLLTLGGERGQIEGGLKYVTLNLISSTVFLIAAALTYAVGGTLNMATLAERFANVDSPGISTVLAALYFIAFGIKAGMFPLFFWLPASYHTPPVAVTALFGGLLTKVGIYSMWRVIGLIFPNDVQYLQPLILAIAAATMITGVLGAIAQTDFRRLLSFHIVSQIGYLIMAFGLFTVDAMAAGVFFVVHVILAKTALFLVSGIVHDTDGTYKLKRLGGVLKAQPSVAMLFLLAALSLAGIPPLAGFWAKLALIRAGLAEGQYLIVAIAIGTSVLTLFSMVKIWNEVFWKKPKPEYHLPPNEPNEAKLLHPVRHRRLIVWPTAVLVALCVIIGVLAEPMIGLATRAATDITMPEHYITTVLPERGAAE